ncbi:MAG: ABC transporter ATP-binding protein [Opitutales bacterium]|nr:ABC transporter ATP-binding protein [Opitutales bacterium]MDP4884597.1 ABC transporter ATP-binding protein [Opitutales bacterium]
MTEQSQQPMVDLRSIAKRYQMGEHTVHALHPLNLQFHSGQFVAIVGPSGSGKSTLLNLLGLLDQASAGEYWLDGQNVANLPDREISAIRCLKIGFIFQSFNLFPSMSVLENVCVPMHYAEKPKDLMRERAMEVLDRLGLKDRIDHKPTELSGGQRQRVAIARALANDPPVLLADEPTGNLDENTGEEVMEIFRELRSEGRSVIMVTHNPEYEDQVDRVISIHDGNIIRS